MQKIDSVILSETKYIASWVIILSVILQSFFLVGGWWNLSVLLGNILSGTVAILNFFLMGLSVQKAVGQEEKESKKIMQASSALRTFMLFAAAALGVLLNAFDTWTVIIPLFFPRIAAAFRPVFMKGQEKKEADDEK